VAPTRPPSDGGGRVPSVVKEIADLTKALTDEKIYGAPTGPRVRQRPDYANLRGL